jgi:HAD superfamily hydrolase (TIGR01490 family)
LQSDIADATPPVMTQHKLAIYDMDKTVTRRATYTPFLIFMARTMHPWRLLLLPLLIPGFLAYILKLWGREPLKEYMQTVMLGRAIDLHEYAEALQQHADYVLTSNLYPEAKDRIVTEKAEGYLAVLATASYTFYVEAIAARLGFDVVIATDLAADEQGRWMPRIVGGNCYAEHKLAKIKTWMAGQGLERGQCHIRAYSDHISDAPFLTFADEAFATNPHPPMAALAKARGWTVLDWRKP